ncbi:hypothetical protein VTL71DRAFT_609 [Oculimacula yallundae]|uniref:Defective in cullin neddylation protein n=1 Tax=Oculimacula yallundae TaxID=86028 RepID=A0ABR4D1L7_9HELO
MTTKTGQKALISQFMSFTGANEKVATRALKATGWKLDQACDSYFLSIGSGSSKSDDTLSALFEKYRVPTDDVGVTTVHGTMKYLADLGVDCESAEFLVALEIVQSPALGEMSKDAFVEGWKRIGADTIAKQKTHVASQISLLSTDMALFKRVYKHAFICSKAEKSQKALPLDAAIVYWQLLFSPPGMRWVTASTNWLQLWTEFVNAKWTRSVNKDMWNQTELFFEKTLQDETMGFWSEDGAWPGVIDQFVEYAKKARGDVPDTMETD